MPKKYKFELTHIFRCSYDDQSRKFTFFSIIFCFCSFWQMHHTMDGLEMLDPSNSMTTLTPMSETPSITSPHHQLHGSYHGMNHMMSHHHGGPLSGHTPSMNHYGKKKILALHSKSSLTYIGTSLRLYILHFNNSQIANYRTYGEANFN